MAITHFIPEVWAAQMLENFRADAVWAGLTNRDYEGEAKSGNTVHVSGVVDVTIHDYKAANRTTTADAISDTGIDIPIDQEKSFDFYVDDIDRAQVAGGLDAYTQSASNGLVDDADMAIATLAGASGTALVPGAEATTAATAWNVIRDLRKALNKAKVPQAQRALVVNAEFAGLLEENDSKIMSADTSGDTAGLREATIGRLLGFTAYNTENMPETSKPQAIALHTSALAFVSQIEKTEALRAENKFADRIRGLHVYGAKVLRPTAIQVYTAL